MRVQATARCSVACTTAIAFEGNSAMKKLLALLVVAGVVLALVVWYQVLLSGDDAPEAGR